jgi:hypothetical protein
MQLKSPQTKSGSMPKSPRGQKSQTPQLPNSKGARKEVYGFVGWMTSFVLFGTPRNLHLTEAQEIENTVFCSPVALNFLCSEILSVSMIF